MDAILTADAIRSILNKLIQETCGFEAFAVTKSLPQLKKLILTETGDSGGLKGDLRNILLGIISEKFLPENVTYSQAENIADNQYKFYVIQQQEGYKPFEFLDGEQETFKDEHLNEVTGFVFAFRYGTQQVFCYQKGRSITVPNRKKNNLITRLRKFENNLILDRQEEPLITIANAIDALIINGNIITDNIKMMERNFDFQAFIQKKAKVVASNVANSGLFANTNKLDEYLSRGGSKRKTYYKKMMRALDSPVLQMTSADLIEKVTTVERWKGKFGEPVDGKIEIKTFKQVEYLIDLLDERYTISPVTNQEYDTSVKEKAEPNEEAENVVLE